MKPNGTLVVKGLRENPDADKIHQPCHFVQTQTHALYVVTSGAQAEPQ